MFKMTKQLSPQYRRAYDVTSHANVFEFPLPSFVRLDVIVDWLLSLVT